VPRPDFGPDQTHANTPAAPSGRPDFGDRHPAAAGGGWAETGEKLLGATSATIGGLGKGAVESFGNAPWGSIPNEDGKSPVLNWAKTEDKNYPVAEKAGRLAAEYAPLAMLPEAGAVRGMAKAIPEFPRVARVIGKGLEGTWKGAVGGATQGDPKTGAEVGGGTAAGTAAFMAAPNWLKTIIGLGALEGGRDLAGGGRLPFGMWHMAHPLALFAAAAMGKFPGLTGALGAKELGDGDQR
jgi:hypothetical protein